MALPAPRDDEESSEVSETAKAAARPVGAARQTPSGGLTYEDGLRHAHDFLHGKSQVNPFLGREGFGELSNGARPANPVPLPQPPSGAGGFGQAVRAVPNNRIGTQPEDVLGPERTGTISSSTLGAGRNIVRETIGGPGTASNPVASPAGLPRAPQSAPSPEVGGTRAVRPLQRFQDGGVVRPMMARVDSARIGKTPTSTSFQAVEPFAKTQKPIGPTVELGTTGNADHQQRIGSPGYAFGGKVPGEPTGEDTQPAMLSPGEVVLNKNQQRNVAVTGQNGLNPKEKSAMSSMNLPRARVQHAKQPLKPKFFRK